MRPGPTHRSLRFQLFVALIAVVAASLGFVIGGALIYIAWVEHRFFQSLSEAAQEAYLKDWAIEGMPAEALVREISLAEEQILQPLYAAELHVVMILAALVTALSIPFAAWAARRLTKPLELASDSARVIAGGEFSHRLSLPRGSSTEVESLVGSFTELAESLERMERDVRFNSAAITHEIRTPITVVQGYLQGIRDGVFEADETLLDTMLQRMDALSRLLADLQTLSMADSGRLTLKRASVRLSERLRRLVSWMGARSTGDLLFVHDESPDPEEPVDIDPERVEQVVIGLIGNARRHAGEQGTIWVHCRRHGEGVEVAVEDDGPGFSGEALGRAAERFWRDPSAADLQGSGLGLAVARAIIEAHGGRLQLENRPEGGAMVLFDLPEPNRTTSGDDQENSPPRG